MSKSAYFLAVDIGASSGRHILSQVVDGKLVLTEVHRFDNGPVRKNGHMCWDTERLFAEIKAGMRKCKKMGAVPASMGIDTWGVDFALLDEKGQLANDTVCYRDERTDGIDKVVYEKISEKDLYARTGIQKQIFNTIYQLAALKEKEPEVLENAETLLMIPDYFNFLLTGAAKQEYTNATTGQLVSPSAFDWDYELIEKLGFPRKLFKKLSMPGTVVGSLTQDVQNEVGFDTKVVLPGTHDTASAVLAVPIVSENAVYISSGTWSLIGVERDAADLREESRAANFTNEGGVYRKFRYLKNIMGLWMIQSVRHELEDKYSFAQLCDMAEASSIESLVDANDDRFLAPISMISEVKAACREAGEQVPESPGELARVIYRSLATCYAGAVKEIEKLTGKKVDAINIVGGGANADYLNRLTREATGLSVYAGPTEATALGNLGAQMIAAGEIADASAFRKLVAESFEVKEYK